MKSTQDLIIFLNKVEDISGSGIHFPDSMLSIEIFSDKSFRINKHNGETIVTTVYDSDLGENIDINGLAYKDREGIAGIIKANLEEKKELDLT